MPDWVDGFGWGFAIGVCLVAIFLNVFDALQRRRAR